MSVQEKIGQVVSAIKPYAYMVAWRTRLDDDLTLSLMPVIDPFEPYSHTAIRKITHERCEQVISVLAELGFEWVKSEVMTEVDSLDAVRASLDLEFVEVVTTLTA